jgi:hypothetical protein
VSVLAVLVSALLAPPAAVLAGVLVASEKAQRAFDNMSGAGGAPSVVWLSLVPAAGGALVGALPMVLAPWIARGETVTALGVPAGVVAFGALAGAAILFVLAAPLARRALPEATREVSAMDQVRLAHVELDRARGFERLVRFAAGAGRPVYDKDVALTRRRYPAYYLWLGAAVILMWIFALAAGEPTRLRWTVGLMLGMTAYTALLARRLVRPPIEHERLLAVLPFSVGAVRRAKLIYLAWRASAPLALGVAPTVIRTEDPLKLIALVLGHVLAGVLVGIALWRQRAIDGGQSP